MQKVYKKSIAYSYVRLGILALSQFILVPFIVKATSEAEYGVYVTFLSIATAFTNVIGWLSASSVRLLANFYHEKNFESFNRLYSLLKVAFGLYSLLVIPGVIILYRYYVSDYLLIDEQPAMHMTLATGFLIWTIVNAAVENSVMNAVARLDFFHLYGSIATVLSLGLSLLLLSIFQDAAVVILCTAINHGVIFFLILSFYRKQSLPIRWNKVWGWRKEEVRQVFFDIGGKASVYSLLRLLLMMDAVLLSFFISASEIAHFSYYWLPANYAIIFLWKFAENVQPFLMKHFSEGDLSANRKLYRKVLMLSLLLGCLAALIYFLALPLFLKIWVDVESVDVVSRLVFCSAIVFLVAYRIDLAVLYADLRYGTLIKLTALELLVKVLGTILLYQKLGFAASIAGHALAHLVVVQYYGKFSVRQIFREGPSKSNESS